ncbi:MAG: glycine--tRNA ligase subunit beta [Candidatus Margulisiibacteriota bacterium]|nr:glycine--tRNA ligase subunit beta [Candidatus Margulisiibacteriota bacterium]
MLNSLLEIGCEEIPARFMPGFLKDLKEKAQEKLKRERLSYKKIETLGTYRRLTLYIEDLEPKQKDVSLDAKGPPAKVAYDPSGNPTKAALGFAKSQGVGIENLEVRDNYVYAKVHKKGKTAEKVLAELFPEIVSSIYQPLAMRWGDIDFKFIRPIHWIVALCGNKTVKFKLAGIVSGNKTSPHRNVGTALVAVRLAGQGQTLSLPSYKKFLLKYGVVVDQDERREKIKKMVEAEAKKVKGNAHIEAELLSEVTFLVEDPIVYVGAIDKSFLKIPQEVLITSMKKNQKYFPILDNKGKLAGRFVVVTDGCKNKSVVAGNQKVLTARLSDAKFFFEEDKKQPLKLRIPDLERVGYFEKLGSMADKSKRIGKLAEWIAKRIGFDGEGLRTVKRISELCKADLTTKMVYEFPILQGIIGKHYALLSGEDPKVAEGIREHYLPRYAEDKIPSSMEGTIVSLADRIDSIVGCFSVGAIPTGSADPYGLRRAAHGIIRIIVEKEIDLLLDEAIEHSFPVSPKVKSAILNFIAARLRPALLDSGTRYDVVDAVLSDFNDILDCSKKAKVIDLSTGEKWFPGVVKSAERVSRIANNPAREEVIEEDLVEKEEKSLFELYMKLNWEVGEAIKEEAWEKALKALTFFTDPLELFFDKVLVMHKDEKLKLNRLALLKSIEKLFLSVADFRKIVLPG